MDSKKMDMRVLTQNGDHYGEPLVSMVATFGAHKSGKIGHHLSDYWFIMNDYAR
jgi:hypothetical protein